MRKIMVMGYWLWVVGLLFLSPTVYAVDYAPFGQTVAPSVSIQSVNNSGYMTVGSSYSSDVYAVGSYSPSSATPSGPRRVSGLGTDDSGYQGGNNPQFSPIGDALIPLLLIALAYTAIRAHRKKRLSEHTSNS